MGKGACLTARNPSFLYLSPYPPPARFLFFFKLQNLPQKKHGMIHHLVCLPRSSFSYWASRPMGSWIWTRQQRCWKCKREGFMISPMYWKASTSLRRNLKTTCNGCEYESWPPRPSLPLMGSFQTWGFLPVPTFTFMPTLHSFALLFFSTLSFSLPSSPSFRPEVQSFFTKRLILILSGIKGFMFD